MTVDLAELRRLLAEASPLPWSEDDCNIFSDPLDAQRTAILRRMLDGESLPHPDGDSGRLGFVASTGQERDSSDVDARFICAAANAVPALLDEVERLRSEVEDYRSGLAAGFGVWTADSHKTLVELGQATERHHQEHHQEADRMRAALEWLAEDSATRCMGDHEVEPIATWWTLSTLGGEAYFCDACKDKYEAERPGRVWRPEDGNDSYQRARAALRGDK